MKADTCGCCEPPAGLVPIEITSRPGLSAIAYRVGAFSSFRQSLLQAIAGTPELSALRTRLSDDYTITILELWSTVADILTFYQERIANEAYLRTATQRDSILRLARLLDYHLNPGMAATTLLAFTVEENKNVGIPVGLLVQSVPGQDEQPQKFETTESITADFRLNRLPIYPRPSSIDSLTDRPEVYLSPGNAGLKIAKSLSTGDQVVLFDEHRLEELTVEGVKAEGDQIILSWTTPVQADWDISSTAFKFSRTFHLFGYNVPETYMVPYPEADPDTGIEHISSWEIKEISEWNDTTVDPGENSYGISSRPELFLDEKYEGIKVGSKLIISASDTQKQLVTVSSVEQAQDKLGSFCNTVTKLTVTPNILNITDRRHVIIYELTGPQISFWGYEYPARITEATVCIPGRKIDEERIEIVRSIEGYQYKPGIEISANDFEVGRKVILHDKEMNPVTATISTLQIMDHHTASTMSYWPGGPGTRPPVDTPAGPGGPGTRPPVDTPAGPGGPGTRPPIGTSSGYGTQEYIVIVLDTDFELNLHVDSAFILGNVALASHGETVSAEVVGSGDGSQSFQQFALQKKPVTFTPYAGPGGAKNSLQVLVNKVRWNETPTLYGKGPDDQVYITRLEEDGTLLLKFGDGNTGARLPTGRNNIVSRYRQGLGLAGRVKENALTTLLERPTGAKSVTNPLPASGGADPESLEAARISAPTTVKTFNRAVSLRDFEDLVKNNGEVTKASATWVWDGLSRAVHLTVAGQKAGLFESPDLARIHASLTTQRDPNNRLLIDNFKRVQITITASLSIADTHIAQEVAKDAHEVLLKHLSFEALEFGETIYLSDIYRVLQDVDGVTSLDINLFHFKDQSSDYLAERGANTASVQQYLRIFPARPMPNEPNCVRPAEQAWIEVPSEDIRIQTEGGLSV